MFKKRAQGLSITTIIVAIIALIVLAVIIAIFSRGLGSFGAGLESIGDPTKKCVDQDSPSSFFTKDQCAVSSAGAEGSGSLVVGVGGGCCGNAGMESIISKDALPGSGNTCCRLQ